MGLDQYLIGKVYVGAKYEHRNVKGVIDITVGDKKLPIDFKKVDEVTMHLGDWHGGNYISEYMESEMGWLGGSDHIDITRHNIEDLMDEALVLRLGEDGEDDCDDLESDLKLFQECLEMDEDINFEYSASW